MGVGLEITTTSSGGAGFLHQSGGGTAGTDTAAPSWSAIDAIKGLKVINGVPQYLGMEEISHRPFEIFPGAIAESGSFQGR